MKRLNYNWGRVFKIILIVFGLSSSVSSAENIHLKSGRKIEGKITEKTDKYIKIDAYGVGLTYYLDEIESIAGGPLSISGDIHSSAYVKTPEAIFQIVGPAVVSITTSTEVGASLLGSGFIVDSNGIIATNYHVVRLAKEMIDIKLRDGRIYPATAVIDYNSFQDFCLLKIDANNLPCIPLGDSNSLSIGETVYSIGSPLGFEYSFSNGLLSGVRSNFGVKLLQFTAPISPGNSGGPLINSKGQAIGIITSQKEGQNLNFALAINEIKDLRNVAPKMNFSEFAKKVIKADFWIEEAEKYLSQKDFHQAIANLEKALQINPNDARATLLLGNVYQGLREYQKAISYLQKAIQINPNDEAAIYAAYTMLAGIYGELNQYQQEIYYYEKFLQKHPQYPTFYHNLGLAYYKLGQHKKAKESFQKAIEIFQSQGDYAGAQHAEEFLKKLAN